MEASAIINVALVTELLNLCKLCMGLFSEFPLNVYLISGLAGIGFGIFAKAKRASHA